ncbi:MAG: hypothetical protein WCA07_09620 [Gloeobacterales cyanobacterium]
MNNPVNDSATNQSSFAETLKNLLTEKEYLLVKDMAARRNACNQLPTIAWAMGFLSIHQLDALLSH